MEICSSGSCREPPVPPRLTVGPLLQWHLSKYLVIDILLDHITWVIRCLTAPRIMINLHAPHFFMFDVLGLLQKEMSIFARKKNGNFLNSNSMLFIQANLYLDMKNVSLLEPDHIIDWV